MTDNQVNGLTRVKFDKAYSYILSGGFTEANDYYVNDKQRYWESFKFYASINLPKSAKLLEIGGGQMAILASSILGHEAAVADISSKYAAPLAKAGIDFCVGNLLDENFKPAQKYDIVVLLEVIEHLPVPGHIVLERMRNWLLPGGYILLTTPNLFRLRNVWRMMTGKPFLDNFTYASPGQGLGHQLEYSKDHLGWQAKRAGLRIVTLKEDQLGQIGHSFKARLLRRITAPLRLNPKWRDGLLLIARAD